MFLQVSLDAEPGSPDPALTLQLGLVPRVHCEHGSSVTLGDRRSQTGGRHRSVCLETEPTDEGLVRTLYITNTCD